MIKFLELNNFQCYTYNNNTLTISKALISSHYIRKSIEKNLRGKKMPVIFLQEIKLILTAQ